MADTEETDQFQILEQKVDGLIEMVSQLKNEKASLAEKVREQEQRLCEQNEQLENLRSARDDAKQRVVALLQKIEDMGY